MASEYMNEIFIHRNYDFGRRFSSSSSFQPMFSHSSTPSQPRSFTESMSNSVIPWREAVALLDEPIKDGCHHSTPSVVSFLIASFKHLLEDPKVRSDLDNRLRSGSGAPKHLHHQCSHHAGHDCDHKDFLTQLIDSATSDTGLEELSVAVVTKATKTYHAVLARGKAEGQTPMDRSTDAFVRRQIWTEALVREIVSVVQKRHVEVQSAQSNEGTLFALPQNLRDPADSEVIGRMLSQVPPGSMAELMATGLTVVKGFSTGSSTAILSELARMDALSVFEQVVADPTRTDQVHWTTVGKLTTYPALRSLCERMSYIPFDLNGKKKSLLLQICQNFQISIFQPGIGQQGMHSDTRSNGRKFTCIVPIHTSVAGCLTPVVRTKEGRDVVCTSSDLIIIDGSRIEYECPPSPVKRFHVTAFLTGPST